MRIMTIAGAALLLAAAALPIANRALDVRAATVDVSAGDNFFAPPSLTIAVGDTVRWTNDGQIIHNVEDDGAAFSSGILQVNDEFTHTYNSAGTFPYTCTLHSGMTGTIIVQDPGTITATTAAGTATPTRTRTATASPSATPSPTGTVVGTVTPLPTSTPVTPPAPQLSTPTPAGGAGGAIVSPNTGDGGAAGSRAGDGVAIVFAALGASMLLAGALRQRRTS